MKAEELYREGRLDDAIEALNAELRSDPTNERKRTFLFELLCFAGDYERANKQLDVLGRGDPEAMTGILSYQRVLECERDRREMFESGEMPELEASARPVRGRLNGEPFERLEDADPRIGARLEVYWGGQYTWIPFEHLASMKAEAPRRLRDLLWISATLEGGEGLEAEELSEVLVPVLTPEASDHSDERVRLGQVTEWVELENGSQAPVGQKMLLVDDEEFPLLEVRELEIDGATPDAG